MRTGLRATIIAGLCLALASGLWIAAPPRGEARGGSWDVQVFNNGTPIWTGISPNVNYTWGAGSPVINGIPTGAPADNFSVRFNTTAFFTAGNYRFTVQVNDGARLYIDDPARTLPPLINDWRSDNVFHTVQADYNFPVDGNHTITIEMRDTIGDAAIIANWALAVGPLPSPSPSYTGTPWYAEFYNGLDLGGAQLFTTTYPPSGLDQNWGQGSPGGTVPVDNWSARFTRTLNVPSDLPEGVYTFYARADDNFRFIVDTTTIIDRWEEFSGAETYTAEVTLLSGPHTLKFEYREREVDAFIFLTWEPPNAQNPVLPPGGGGAAPTPGGGTPGQPAPTPVPALTGTVNVATLNVRAGPSITTDILAKISRGESYPIVGRTADAQWAQISAGGATGWVFAQYMTFSGDLNAAPVVDAGGAAAPPPPSDVRGVTLGNLRIRQGPSATTPTLGVIPWGTTIDLLGVDYRWTWYQVNYAGTVGWSYAPWIRITQGSDRQLPYADGTEPAFRPPPASEGVVAQAFGNMRIRSGPGLTFPQIDRAIWGTRVQVLGRSTDRLWYKIKYGDLVGWSYARWYRIVQGDITSVPITDQ